VHPRRDAIGSIDRNLLIEDEAHAVEIDVKRRLWLRRDVAKMRNARRVQIESEAASHLVLRAKA
jgi:hypothetical protein